jgi:hypothetical protein
MAETLGSVGAVKSLFVHITLPLSLLQFSHALQAPLTLHGSVASPEHPHPGSADVVPVLCQPQGLPLSTQSGTQPQVPPVVNPHGHVPVVTVVQSQL